MSILKPDIIWVGNSAFRCNKSSQHLDHFEEETGFDFSKQMCDEDRNVDVTNLYDGTFWSSLDVSSVFYGNIIGRKGKLLKFIQNHTQCRINVPRSNQTKKIEIRGGSHANVARASNMIRSIVREARNRMPPTHFVAVCVTDCALLHNYSLFRERVLRECSQSRGVCAQLFQAQQRLHITLSMILLLDAEDRSSAFAVADRCFSQRSQLSVGDKQKSEQPPALITLRGVDVMRRHNCSDDAVRVLYACVRDPSGLLQALADQLTRDLAANGLCQAPASTTEVEASVRLHCTLMNTKFRRSESVPPESGSDGANKYEDSFDATEILAKFANYFFGSFSLERLHVLERFTWKEDGSYTVAYTCSLNNHD